MRKLSATGKLICLGFLLALAAIRPANAGLAALNDKDAAAGLREALTRGAEFAVAELGKQDGFLGNGKVRIPLPASLQKIEGMARTLGLSRQADQLVETLNRAAEAAVGEAKPLLVEAVRKMSVKDAKDILSGPGDAATQYFRRTTAEQLTRKFQPIVAKATAKVKLAEKYNAYAGKAAELKLIDGRDANLDAYVTQKAIDGLFVMIAEQESRIRQDPVGTGSKLLGKVFGALGRN